MDSTPRGCLPTFSALQRFLVDKDEPADAGSCERMRDRRTDRSAAEHRDCRVLEFGDARVVAATVNPRRVDALDRIAVGRDAANRRAWTTCPGPPKGESRRGADRVPGLPSVG